MNLPEGSSWSSRIFEVMPKLLSTASLPKTNGYCPLSVAVTQLGATQLGGSKVVLATTFAGRNLMSSSSANALVAPMALDNKIVTARLLRKTGGQIAKRDPAIFICKFLPRFRQQRHAMRGDLWRFALALLQT